MRVPMSGPVRACPPDDGAGGNRLSSLAAAAVVAGAPAWAGLLGSAALTFAAAWIGSRFRPGSWYRELRKPAWTPPAAIFPPVWTLLYLLMAVSAWLVWRRGGPGAGLALAVYVLQLALNALWSWIFFGLHRPDMAALEIGLLWLAILATVLLFWRIYVLAGVLLLPYLAWVSFAVLLNYAIQHLNPSGARD